MYLYQLYLTVLHPLCWTENCTYCTVHSTHTVEGSKTFRSGVPASVASFGASGSRCSIDYFIYVESLVSCHNVMTACGPARKSAPWIGGSNSCCDGLTGLTGGFETFLLYSQSMLLVPRVLFRGTCTCMLKENFWMIQCGVVQFLVLRPPKVLL